MKHKGMDKDMALRQYHAHTGNLPNGVHFKRIGNNTVDLFHGDGFSQPSRYRLVGGKWAHVSGSQTNAVDAIATRVKV